MVRVCTVCQCVEEVGECLPLRIAGVWGSLHVSGSAVGAQGHHGCDALVGVTAQAAVVS